MSINNNETVVANLRKEVVRLHEERDKLREERDKLRKEVNKLRTELKVRDLIIAMYEHELSEALKDLEILGRVNMSLGAMIAVNIDKKSKKG